MLVLVTRPPDQAAATAQALAGMGHRAIIDPVMEIRALTPRHLELGGVGALAVTSANAVHALTGLPALPVFAVGEATADAVAEATGRRPETARGDGGDLARLIAATRSPAAGAVLHLAGAETSQGLARELAAAGFAYRRTVVYEAVPRLELEGEALAALRAGTVEAVLLYSPRSARLWAEKVARAGLAQSVRGILAACLSPAVAEALAGLGLAQVRVAATPDGAALLRLLEAPR